MAPLRFLATSVVASLAWSICLGVFSADNDADSLFSKILLTIVFINKHTKMVAGWSAHGLARACLHPTHVKLLFVDGAGFVSVDLIENGLRVDIDTNAFV